ncbi:MAG: acetylglutamate kinase, partial [Candidatus Omnitrophica bacterium]|nr:acetylglutamate kinase [Candidatus Omnitrophota bacterium]
ETMTIVEEALTEVNREIVQEIMTLGASAISLSGKDEPLIVAAKHPEINGVDIGFVGAAKRVNSEIIGKMATSDIIPVISPIGIGKDGYAYNINADTAAAEIARALKALKFVLLTDTDGILMNPKDPSTLIAHMGAAQVEEYITSGVITGGMIPKVRACLKALDRGVKKAHIINGKTPHALLLEIFTDHGIGSEIVKKSILGTVGGQG